MTNIPKKPTTRMGMIVWIIDRKNLDFGFPPTEEKYTERMAASWKEHFDRAQIPTERLEDAYMEAMAGRDEKTLFTPTTIIQAWHRLVERENQQARMGLNKKCDFCKDTGKIQYDKDGVGRVEMECPYH